MQLNIPFASKELPDGKKLYRRKYGYEITVAAASSTTFEATVPYDSQKVNEIEIFGAALGLKADFKILDTAAGTYSTVPSYVLDQFGFSVNIAKDFFHDISPYDAHLYTGMRIQVVFNNPGTEYVIGVNLVYHEVR
jgi:hypothetical protein